MSRYYFLLACFLWVCHVTSFQIPQASFGYRVQRRLPSSATIPLSNTVLLARPEVGEVVLAEVDDVGGSFKDPMVFFNIKRDGKLYKGRLPAKTLTSQERLAIQSGTMMQVSVAGQDQAGYLMSLPNKASIVEYNRKTEKRQVDQRKPPAGSSTPKGPLINNLKTGMKFEGTVVHVTPYSAFVAANIFRRAKGGVFAPVDGLLSKADMSEDVLNVDQDGYSRRAKAFELEKGSKVTVYVKEVYKNAGRFTWTMNPNIKKQNVLEEKRQIREDGKIRRQSRRLRRQLESVFAGDTLTGVVDKVSPEGIHITISSLGPLNVTSIIGIKDLPKQFEVPGDLASAFQLEILAQDFYPGREVKCSVLKIHPNPSPSRKYNMKLLFEEFTTKSHYDDLEIEDKGDFDVKKIQSKKMKDDEDEDNEEEDAEEEEDEEYYDEEEIDPEIEEIFNELRGDDEKVSIDNLLAWSDLQDMIAVGEITKEDITGIVRSVVTKGKQMDLEQFEEVIGMIQDKLEDGDDDDEDSEEVGKKTQSSSQKPINHQKPSVQKADVDEDEFDGADEYDDTEEISEIYDGLKGDSYLLSVSDLRNWEEMKDLFRSKQLTATKLDQMLTSLGVNVKKGLTLDEFKALVNAIDEAIMMEEDALAAMTTTPNKSKDLEAKTKDISIKEPESKSKLDNDDNDDNEEEDEEIFKEIYDGLKNKQGVVTVSAIKSWEDIKEMIANDDISEKDVDAIIEDVMGFSIATDNAKVKKGKKNSSSEEFIVSYDQFKQIVEILDDAMQEEEEIVEEEKNNKSASKSSEKSPSHQLEEIDVEESENDDELSKELFEELSRDGKTVKVKDLRDWEELEDLFNQDYLDKDSFEALLVEVGSKPNGSLNLDQFSQLLRLIDETTQAMMGDNDPEDLKEVDFQEVNKDKQVQDEPNDDYIDEEDEEDDDDDEGNETMNEEILREMFDNLRGKASKLSMTKFKQWDELQEMLDSKAMSESNLKLLINEVTGQSDPKDLTFEQFKELAQLLYQANDMANGDVDSYAKLDEETSREFFDFLKGKNNKVTIKSLKAWDVVKEEIEAGALTMADVDEAIKEAGFTATSQLDFDGFQKVLDNIGDRVKEVEGAYDDDEYDEEEEDGEDDNGDSQKEEKTLEEIAHEKREAALQAAFNHRAPIPLVSPGTGFQRKSEEEIKEAKLRAKQSKAPIVEEKTQKLQTRIDDATQALFDDLRGKKQEIPLEKFRKWSELEKMVENGKIKRSTVERALNKVGVLNSESLNMEQFAYILDVLQKAIDINDLGSSMPTGKVLATSKNSKIHIDDENRSNEEEEDKLVNDEDIDEEESAMELFEELCGPKRKLLPLADFFQWEDIQMLLDSGALSKEKLALAVDQSGVDVSKPEDCKLNFQTFFDLLQIIDAYVDSSKLDPEEDEAEKSTLTADDVASSQLVGEDDENDEESDDYTGEDGEDDYEEDEDLLTDDEEVEEMFQDLSKGKGYITEKDLRSWPELKEMIASNVIKKSTVDSYISSLKIKNGKIDLENFKQFVEYLDGSMFDEDSELGDFLAE